MQPAAQARFSNLFLDLFEAAEFDARGALRLVRLHPSANFFRGEHLAVRVDFMVQVRVCAMREEQVFDEAANLHKEWHGERLLFVA